MDEDDLTKELSDKYLLLPSKTKNSKIVLIETKDKIVTAMK